MTIIFPRAMPDGFVSQQNFVLARIDYQAPEASGALGGVQAGWPRWTGTWTVGTTSQRLSDQVEAWITSLRGSQRRFLGRDFRRPLPLRHQDGFSRMTRIDGSPFIGAGTAWAQTIDAAGSAVVTVQGLPSGLILSFNDYLGFKWDAVGSSVGTYDRRALTRVIEGAAADASGAITVTVEPALPTWLPTTAMPHLDKPACLMKLTPETQMADVDRRLRISGTKIVGAQDLRP